VGRHIQAGEEAGDTAAGRRRAGVVPTSGAGLPDADQPGSAESDDRGEKEGAGVRVIPNADSSRDLGHPRQEKVTGGTHNLPSRIKTIRLARCDRMQMRAGRHV